MRYTKTGSVHIEMGYEAELLLRLCDLINKVGFYTLDGEPIRAVQQYFKAIGEPSTAQAFVTGGILFPMKGYAACAHFFKDGWKKPTETLTDECVVVADLFHDIECLGRKEEVDENRKAARASGG